MMSLRLTLRRLVAYGLDVLVLAAVLLPLAFGIAAVLGTDGLTGPDVWVRQLATISVPAWAYFILTDRLGRGRSVGKRALGLATRGPDGAPPGWAAAIARTALKLLPWELVHIAFFAMARSFERVEPIQLAVAGSSYVLMAVYVVVALLNAGERSVPDIVASTRVASVEVRQA
jgi:uncharacterized RDD family membrane protein YckC